MIGKGTAFGAISIVNAIATGKGAALGIDIKTEAEVKLLEKNDEINVDILNPHEKADKQLARYIIKEVLSIFGKKLGARVITKSQIPIGKGLKSSSVASNAITLATLAALKQNLSDRQIIDIGVNASLKAGVTITGAFDDASASYFGGIVVTDNFKRKIIKKEKINDFRIVIYIPEAKIYTKSIDKTRFNTFRTLFDEAFSLAVNGDYWNALTLNGLLSSSSLSLDPKPSVDALCSGALAAGLSGTGPSIASVCRGDIVDKVLSVWKELPGTTMVTRINKKKAKAESID
jgi:shikimate kinase